MKGTRSTPYTNFGEYGRAVYLVKAGLRSSQRPESTRSENLEGSQRIGKTNPVQIGGKIGGKRA